MCKGEGQVVFKHFISHGCCFHPFFLVLKVTLCPSPPPGIRLCHCLVGFLNLSDHVHLISRACSFSKTQKFCLFDVCSWLFVFSSIHGYLMFSFVKNTSIKYHLKYNHLFSWLVPTTTRHHPNSKHNFFFHNEPSTMYFEPRDVCNIFLPTHV
jgi:hypothetical protein